MPKFTITTDGGEGPERSDEALEFADTKAVIDDAQIALVEMVPSSRLCCVRLPHAQLSLHPLPIANQG
ncbi:hypothetical protein OIU35_13620 [Boseaceae bacterium BT-24-1]|nr:hypothetical protein [Boseaceae bacterium BT-24-1]